MTTETQEALASRLAELEAEAAVVRRRLVWTSPPPGPSPVKMDDLKHGIGANVRTARLHRRMTQHELASPEYTKAYISALENGVALPSVTALFVLAQRLGVPPSYLLGEGK